MALQNRAALTLLQDRAVKAVEAAQKEYAQAIKKVDGAKQQAEMLQNYKQGYREGLDKSMEKGLTIDTLQNYNNFLNKLDEAIATQAQVIEMAEAELSVYRSALQSCQKKKLSYDVLIERANKVQQKAELKRDQKMMDEFAMRAMRKSKVE